MISPNHVAIIMDGNGRWANNRKHNRVFGHIRGAKVAYKIIKHCAKKNLNHLTLFAFSTENWRRPKAEVSLLMSLLIKNLKKEQSTLLENNIVFNTIGDISKLPPSVQKLIQTSKEITKQNTGLKLTFALNYGGKQEILGAIKNIVEVHKQGHISIDDINDDLISENLQSAFLPDPDLIIRTSNEQRLSNFFLWQSAYSEFYFSGKFWPDFTSEDFDSAIIDFNNRQRRFGSISQVKKREQDNSYG